MLMVLFVITQLLSPISGWAQDYTRDQGLAFHARAHLKSDGRLFLALSPRTKPSDFAKYDLLVGSGPSEITITLSPLYAKGDGIMLNVPSPREMWDKWLFDSIKVKITHNNAQAEVTEIQTAEYLDAHHTYTGNDLGLTFHKDKPSLTLWAPTARSVHLLLFADPEQSVPSMRLPLARNGSVWRIEGEPPWRGLYYLYEINLYSPHLGQMATFQVTDPYSISLSANSQRSQIIDLTDPQLIPSNWTTRPNHQNIVIYETHIRDFTVGDTRLPHALRGRFDGFAAQDSLNLAHLEKLADAGVTYIHLLPVMDFATVQEHTEQRRDPVLAWNGPNNSTLQQDQIGRVRHDDSYNWGYDPVHFFALEGSYASQPNGSARVLEFRKLISRLHHLGFGLILDVVFNHTYADGLRPFSVFDRIVPLYYHRRNATGQTFHSSCCPDLATEHLMVEKLILDCLKNWLTQYHVSGFRFDLLNLHPIDSVQRIRKALKAEYPHVVLYGEAWSFGSLDELSPGSAFFQTRSAGLGIGTFNDRFRDAIRGGTPHLDELSDQGWATGLFYDFNHAPSNQNTPIKPDEQRIKLDVLTDVIKLGLAGNLRDFQMRDFLGNLISGGNHRFRGQMTSYAATPLESVAYVSSHDGLTLWDSIQAKMPFATPWRSPDTADLQSRLRRQLISLALPIFSQGMVFLEGGTELLRTKSGDVDSYDSGDWFNQITFDYPAWGMGLPPAWKNKPAWPFWTPRLTSAHLTSTPQDQTWVLNAFLSLLKVRKSSPLFTLQSLSAVQQRLRFLEPTNTSLRPPGLIALQLLDDLPNDILDRLRRQIVVFFNPHVSPLTLTFSELRNRSLTLHRNWTEAFDASLAHVGFNKATGEVTLPPLAVVVFEELRP